MSGKGGWLRDRDRCSNSQTLPTISCRSALSSRAPSWRRTSRSSTCRAATACSSLARGDGPTTSSSRACLALPIRSPRGRRPACTGPKPTARPEGARRRHTTIRTAACLVLRTPRGARDWSDHHRDGRFLRIAGGLGRALAALHAIPADAAQPARRASTRCGGCRCPSRRTNSILRLSARVRTSWRDAGQQAAVPATAARCGSSADSDALVHGDLRWANCLVFAVPGSRRRTRVLVIDWELAGPAPRRSTWHGARRVPRCVGRLDPDRRARPIPAA